MKRKALLAMFLAAVSAIVFAQLRAPDNPVNPNLGGSPFPQGKEPSLTHTATVFWTTQGGLTTDVHIKAEGERATQFACWKVTDGKREYLSGSIAPECNYHLFISQAKTDAHENARSLVADGQGCLEVRVHGFKREDFGNPPLVCVSYAKDGKIVGETKIISHPLPEKFKDAKQSSGGDAQNRAPQP